ncbi:hypothetical protein [Saccharopolyspora sp. ASAGF58]|uniref:hypothetical protein n=1 Tax=Saccharopolyspora sp. ASAGF58 TaxID=2719023 RepID=UPI001FF0C91A|nr:hypothetical protein [Saccharopolyspora sp. ASAGF58]
MKLPRTSRPVVGLLIAFLVALGIPAAAAAAAPENVPVVTYDARQAAEFRDAVDAGANVWKENVRNLRLEPATGGAADAVVLADDGWPRAEVIGLGQGRVWMGRQAVNEGHGAIRIAAH